MRYEYYPRYNTFFLFQRKAFCICGVLTWHCRTVLETKFFTESDKLDTELKEFNIIPTTWKNSTLFRQFDRRNLDSATWGIDIVCHSDRIWLIEFE